MSAAAITAALAATAGVWAAWDALTVLSTWGRGGALTRLIAPGGGAREATRAERRRLGIVAALTLAAAGVLIAGPLAAPALAAAGPIIGTRLPAWQRARRRRALAAGLPTVARAIADALAGGHAIGGALAAAAEVPGPAGEEAGRIAAAIALGATPAAALTGRGDLAGLPLWDAVVTAILLTQEIGGDLAGLLRTVADGADAGRRAEAQARAAIAQARATARLVGLAPLAAGAGLELLRPGTITVVVASPLPLLLASLGGVLAIAGAIVIARLSRGLGR